MKGRKSIRLIVLGSALMLMVLAAVTCQASDQEYYIEKHTETLIDGKSAGGASVLKLWVKKDRVRYNNSHEKDNTFVIRMDEDKAYQLNEKDKTYKTVDLKAKFAAVEREVQVASKKTDLKKKVDNWDTYQVVLTSSTKGIATEVEYWLCESIKLPLDSRLKMSDYFGQRKIIEELKQYPGYPVEIVVHLKVHDKKIDMVTKVVKLEEKEIDGNLFNIPKDYKQQVEPSTETTKPITPPVDPKAMNPPQAKPPVPPPASPSPAPSGAKKNESKAPSKPN